MKDKFIKKFMRQARLVGSDQNPCLSRGIGSVVVDPVRERVVSMGYNGPARGIPHADTEEFLREYVFPQLTKEDKCYIFNTCKDIGDNYDDHLSFDGDDFARTFEGCKTCPRKLVGAVSGQRLDLCQCVHSEHNAILNATECLAGFYMFAYCGIPCVECSTAIIQSGIKRVYCLRKAHEEKSAYMFWRSQWLFDKADVEVVRLDEEWIDQDDHT